MQARRYAPFAVLILAQLVVVGLAPPSRRCRAPAPTPTAASAAELRARPGRLHRDAGGGRSDGHGRYDAGCGGGAAGGGAASGSTTGGGSTPAGGSGLGGAAQGAAPGAPAKGDTGHCKNGRQFAGTLTPPPCVAKWTNGANNGGATYRGVSTKTIKIVYFGEKDNPAVKGLLQSQDLYSEPGGPAALPAGCETFLNKHYEFYGRKLELSLLPQPLPGGAPGPLLLPYRRQEPRRPGEAVRRLLRQRHQHPGVLRRALAARCHQPRRLALPGLLQHLAPPLPLRRLHGWRLPGQADR